MTDDLQCEYVVYGSEVHNMNLKNVNFIFPLACYVIVSTTDSWVRSADFLFFTRCGITSCAFRS